MISVNQRAIPFVEQLVREQEALGIGVSRLRNGTTVIDAGIEVPGSLEAGRLCACACMGGLAQVGFTHQTFQEPESDQAPSFCLPAVAVSVSYPALACLAAQYAGWAVKLESFFAIGSGPARALCAEEEIFHRLNYRDKAESAFLLLEGSKLPDEAVASWVAEKCGIAPERLTLMIAPTASLVGSVQIAARAVETGMHKMMELGFDVRWVTAAYGLCPVAPVAEDDEHAIGRTNDAILYGAQIFCSVQGYDEELQALVPRIPSCAAPDYGVPFYELFTRYGKDFYRIDRMLFSPAQVQINNLNSGRVFNAGRPNPSLLRASLLQV